MRGGHELMLVVKHDRWGVLCVCAGAVRWSVLNDFY